MSVARRRPYLVGAVIITVAAGLASRKWPWLLPAALGKFPGDVLWAQMVYWTVGFLAPTASICRVGAWALAIAYADECSQIYQATWINQIRATTWGHLIFGSTFSWWDLLAYSIGVGLCCIIEVIVLKLASKR
ncbi:MAG TPA: DUF2809 domain-containing protein [Verrucomicrobiae bacterium]|jgi:hypothetical protein